MLAEIELGCVGPSPSSAAHSHVSHPQQSLLVPYVIRLYWSTRDATVAFHAGSGRSVLTLTQAPGNVMTNGAFGSRYRGRAAAAVRSSARNDRSRPCATVVWRLSSQSMSTPS